MVVGQSIPKTGLIRLTYIRNTGAAFGLFQEHSFALTIFGLIIMGGLLFYTVFMSHRFPYFDNMPGRTVLGLIMGGATGNLLDRLRFGHVTDFIDLGFWPAFNVADSAVTVAIVTLACWLLGTRLRVRT